MQSQLFAIELAPAAERDLNALPKEVFRRVDTRLMALAKEPRPRGTKKLSGGESLYRLRVGHYRILYHVDENRRVVTVARVGHRRDIYRLQPT